MHEENSEFKIIGFLTYTNYTEYGNPDKPYRWEHRYGSRDLSYDRFKNPMKTKRYDRPLDIDTEGLKVYDEDI
ncbi:hypothetical protein N9355_07370 [Crocinitomicaceae bacterium]|nr:hypothetical protein [Crocinitomicaceae bacterium]